MGKGRAGGGGGGGRAFTPRSKTPRSLGAPAPRAGRRPPLRGARRTDGGLEMGGRGGGVGEGAGESAIAGLARVRVKTHERARQKESTALQRDRKRARRYSETEREHSATARQKESTALHAAYPPLHAPSQRRTPLHRRTLFTAYPHALHCTSVRPMRPDPARAARRAGGSAGQRPRRPPLRRRSPGPGPGAGGPRRSRCASPAGGQRWPRKRKVR